MIEDDRDALAGQSGSAIRYDYYKYLTSLCIFSLGGVLALADRVPEEGRGKELLIGALVVISFAAVLSFSGVGEFVRAASEGSAPRKSSLKWAAIAPVALSVGLGMFIYLFVKSLLG